MCSTGCGDLALWVLLVANKKSEFFQVEFVFEAARKRGRPRPPIKFRTVSGWRQQIRNRPPITDGSYIGAPHAGEVIPGFRSSKRSYAPLPESSLLNCSRKSPLSHGRGLPQMLCPARNSSESRGQKSTPTKQARTGGRQVAAWPFLWLGRALRPAAVAR